jgi:peptidoglycan/xylan/chitin deacetylase (PgdA/CDA1 family)
MRRALAALAAVVGMATVHAACQRPVYLTFDTGHMGVAPLVAQVLQEEGVSATFFLADEPTQDGGSSLDERWAPWWRRLASQGHDFGSHTWAHDIWVADLPDGRMRFKTQAGRQVPRFRTLDAAEYCTELKRSAERFEAMTGRRMGRVFRAPGGKTSPRLLAAAQACGYTHVGWTSAGFLGDELPSESHPNAMLLDQALRRVREGDVLLAHLGIWSRRDPWAPSVLKPLVQGLKARGLCFAPLREHPRFGPALTAP